MLTVSGVTMKPVLLKTFLAFCCGLVCSEATEVSRIRVQGPIGPSTVSYLQRAIDISTREGRECLVLELDTPGGLLDSTKEIVSLFYASKIPVVVYVAPSGASATSAGCFITLAAHIAAMAPNTSIGAAHPVSLGPSGAQQQDEVMKEKLENYASSYMESIATKRQRNVEWAVSSVRESASITAEKALNLKTIDLIATDMADLLRQLDGRKVEGKALKTGNATVVDVPMITREKVFQLLWRPEVMLILMLAAIYGIIGELSNPGAILPGVVGGIALILSLYMAAVLPVNVAGVALIVLAVALFIIDVFAPTHGVLTGGGIISFFLGALFLFDRAEPAFRLSLAWIIPATVITTAFFIFIIGSGLRAQRLPIRTGQEAMMGHTVKALETIGPSSGKVFFDGEYWNAVSETTIPAGAVAQIVGLDGLTLRVVEKAASDKT
jgi:membrane-bound serine protease (ClpP class)